jgi:hypothetical protein
MDIELVSVVEVETVGRLQRCLVCESPVEEETGKMPLWIPSVMKRHLVTQKHKAALQNATLQANSGGPSRADSQVPSLPTPSDNVGSSGTSWIRQFTEPAYAPPRHSSSVPTHSQPARPPIFTPSFSASELIDLEVDPRLQPSKDTETPAGNDATIEEYRLASVLNDHALAEVESEHALSSLFILTLTFISDTPSWEQEDLEPEEPSRRSAPIDPNTYPWPDLKVFQLTDLNLCLTIFIAFSYTHALSIASPWVL